MSNPENYKLWTEYKNNPLYINILGTYEDKWYFNFENLHP